MALPTPNQKIHSLEILAYTPGMKRGGRRISRAVVECRCMCGKIFSTSWESVACGTSKTCGCSRRQGLVIDETKFATIETPDDAYWLGMILTDGCVTDRGLIKLSLKVDDRDHVEKFAKFLGATHAVKTSLGKPVHFEGKGYQCSPQSHLAINSVIIVKNLLSHGISPRKTWTCRAWDGPPNLMLHFWRGCVDGDGSVLYYPDRPTMPRVGLCGNQHVVKAFADYVKNETGYDGNLRTWQTAAQKGGENYFSDVRWATAPQAQAVIKLLGYADEANTALARKREAAMKILACELRDRHDDLPREELIEKFKEFGTWGKVAKFYGITPGTMTFHIQKAGITEGDVIAYRSGHRARGKNKSS